MSNSLFQKAPVTVQKLTAFDKSNFRALSGNIGTLIPFVVDKVMPGTKLSLGANVRVQMPPMASDWVGKVDCRMELFAVPYRLLYGGWKEYQLYSGGVADQFKPAGLSRTYLPLMSFGVGTGQISGAGSLVDYLGSNVAAATGNLTNLDLDFFLAYHKVWEDWYRDPRVQAPCFSRANTLGLAARIPYETFTSQQVINNSTDHILADGVSITALRQRNYDKDYFTNAFTDQYGGAQPMKVTVESPLFRNLGSSTVASSDTISTVVGTPIPVSGTGKIKEDDGNRTISFVGDFSIPQLRLANSLQQFAEQQALAGGRYATAIKATYGVTPADALIDRSIYLGRIVSSVKNNVVMMSESQVASTSNNNPFNNQTGSIAADSRAYLSNSFVQNFEAKEWCVLIGLMSLVPHAIYGTGQDRKLFSQAISGDGFVDRFCIPQMCSVGHQPIYSAELSDTAPFTVAGGIFGYSDRYSEYKWIPDRLCGLMHAGEAFESFTLQRVITGTPTINSSFITVPKSAMDNVTAVTSELSTYGFWADVSVQYSCVQPLPAYSIPSLCADKHTREVIIDRGGTRL